MHVKSKINKYRKLLYSLCISSNGNFHLQSRLLVKTLVQDPSFFGDFGFFTPYKVYQDYTRASQLIKPLAKVNFTKKPNVSLTCCCYRTKCAVEKREQSVRATLLGTRPHQQEREKLKGGQSKREEQRVYKKRQ